MREKKMFLCRSVMFLLLLCTMIYALDRTLMIKYPYTEKNPVSETYRGFYEMEENTVDVLFLGSSHMGTGLFPQYLYDNFNICSYNLASSGQSLWASYYWLCEALKYQSPCVVVLDTYTLFRDCRKDEVNTRMTFDEMRLGKVKLAAIQTITKYDTNRSSLEFLFPHVRFHGRWTNLKEQDFTWMDGIEMPPELKGAWLYHDQCNDTDYRPLENVGADTEEMQQEAKEYLDKIELLCKENEIDLILIKTPAWAQTAKRHNTVKAYADAHGLDFYDFNMKEIYEEIGFNYSVDMSDSSRSGTQNAHANPVGARKMTYYIGERLLMKYGARQRKNWQWDNTKEFNDGVWKDYLLHNEKNFSNYLALLRDKRYTVLIAVKDDAASFLSDELQQQLCDLGLQVKWDQAVQQSYFAVLEGGQVTKEKMGDKLLDYTGSFRNGTVVYQVTSAGYRCGNKCSININGSEQAKKKRGFNIVVYNNEMKKVIDSVCFDTHDASLTAIR